MNNLSKKNKIILFIVMIAVILISVLPMGLSPVWNGEIPDHRNQYEKMADAILDGHLYLDYDVDQGLLDMENPYDPDARRNLGVHYHFDHAFYKGKYYMYFGVAPVFLTFIPYKLITGHSLTTYHATQIYVGTFIIGVFALFYLICKLFYKDFKFYFYLLCASIFSLLCVWYAVGAPALYCTAITAGLCLAIWSVYFFVKAVYDDVSLNKSILFAFLGSLFGALTFACRPPIGLINILVIPLLITYLKKHKLNKELFGKLVVAALPYFVIAALLMMYNYVRFDNPFEFGQTYQLTIADQHNYGSIFSNIDLGRLFKNVGIYFLEISPPLNHFPYVNYGGILLNFPILLFPYIMIFDGNFVKRIKEKKIWPLYLCLLGLPILIIVVDSLFSPFPLERYRMDVYYIMIISTFISICNSDLEFGKNKIYKIAFIILLILTLVKIVLLFLVPNDYNFTSYYHWFIND